MNFPYYIARRYLFSKKSKNIINIISGISMFVVMGVTCAMIIVLSALNGIEDLVKQLFNNFETELSVKPIKGKTFEISDSTISYLQALEDIDQVAKIIEGDVWVRNQRRDINTVCTIKGVPSDYDQMSEIDSMMYKGEYKLEDENYYYGILGLGVFSELQVYLKENELTSLYVNAPIKGKKLSTSREKAFKSLPIIISGCYSVNAELDVKYLIAPIEFCQDIFEYENQITGLEIKLKEGFDSHEVKEKISHLFDENLKLTTREERNALVYQTNESEKWATLVILLFILIIAAFNIVASLSMLIIEKKKDIHILRSMGAKEDTIKKIFVLEGILIYFIGALIGIALGIIICLLQQKFGLIKIVGATVPYYPIKILYTDIIIVMISVMIVGFFFSKLLVSRLLKRFV